MLVYSIIILSFIFGYIASYKFNYQFTIGVVKGFSALLLLFWIDKYRILNKLLLPSLLICFITVFTLLVYLYYPSILKEIYVFSMRHNATIMIGIRSFLNKQILMIFYKSLPLLIIPASLYTYRFFNKKISSWKDFFIMIFLLITLFLGGTRACMLASLVIFSINFITWLYNSKFGKLIVIPLFVLFCIAFGFLFFSLISEKTEESNKIKFANLDSYSDLIKKNPIVLFSGQGAGAEFYSKGREEMVVQTEWSYLELIRMFGLVGAVVIIMMFFYPLYLILKKKNKLFYSIPFFVGYLLYLIVGGTNPLLLGSTGMLALLTAYSYALNPCYEITKW
jgi:hypothetical protein